jgi:hypothetical protein
MAPRKGGLAAFFVLPTESNTETSFEREASPRFPESLLELDSRLIRLRAPRFAP